VFRREAQPAYEDFMQNSLSERRAKIAARSINDQLEWTFQYYLKLDESRLSGNTKLNPFASIFSGNVKCFEVDPSVGTTGAGFLVGSSTVLFS